MIQVLASYLLLMIFKYKQYTNCLDRITCNKNSKFEHDREHAIKLIKLGQEKLNKKAINDSLFILYK